MWNKGGHLSPVIGTAPLPALQSTVEPEHPLGVQVMRRRA